MTTTGPTSEPEFDAEASPTTCAIWPNEYGPGDDAPLTDLDHRTRLVEHHELVVPATYATLEQLTVALNDAREQADAWLASQGLEADVVAVDRWRFWDETKTNAAGEACVVISYQVREVGVEWSVDVGHATSDAQGTTWDEIATRQHWTWSHRWERWADWFARMRAPRALALRMEQWCDPEVWAKARSVYPPIPPASVGPDGQPGGAGAAASARWTDMPVEHGPDEFGPPR